MRLVCPGALPLTSTSVGATAVASAISPKPTETRSIGSALFTTTDLPTVTNSSFGDSSLLFCAVVGRAACPAAGCIATNNPQTQLPIITAVADLPCCLKKRLLCPNVVLYEKLVLYYWCGESENFSWLRLLPLKTSTRKTRGGAGFSTTIGLLYSAFT